MAGTDALPDSWSLGFSEHWEVEKNQRLILVFSVFSQPSAKVPALFSHPLLGRPQQVEWEAPYRGWGALGEAEDEAPFPRCCFQPAQTEVPPSVTWPPAREAG